MKTQITGVITLQQRQRCTKVFQSLSVKIMAETLQASMPVGQFPVSDKGIFILREQ